MLLPPLAAWSFSRLNGLVGLVGPDSKLTPGMRINKTQPNKNLSKPEDFLLQNQSISSFGWASPLLGWSRLVSGPLYDWGYRTLSRWPSTNWDDIPRRDDSILTYNDVGSGQKPYRRYFTPINSQKIHPEISRVDSTKKPWDGFAGCSMDDHARKSIESFWAKHPRFQWLFLVPIKGGR